MIRNYFLTAFRTLLRNRSYALLNIAGLSVGITACTLIFLLLRFELSFDDFHTRKDRIFRVATEFKGEEGPGYTGGVPDPVPDALRADFPQLEAIAPIFTIYNGQITTYRDAVPVDRFREDLGIILADQNFFKVFDFKFINGGPQGLAEPNTAVLTRETADRYFGDWKKAIGQTVRFNYDTTAFVKITGVLENPPVNTDLPFKVLVSYKTRRQGTNWGGVRSDMQCFVVLPEGMSEAKFEGMMPAFSKKHREPRDASRVTQVLQPLGDLHFDDRFGTYTGRTISRRMVTTLALTGLFLLVTACINFINLATAQAVKRAKEVGVRKVLGGGRGQLMGQFLGETALITLTAIVISVAIAVALLPHLNDLMDMKIPFSVFNAQLFGFLALVLLIVSLLSGLYPAFVLSGFQPVAALKSKMTTTSLAGLSLRRGLVVLQFVISQVLIIGTLVAVSQMRFFKNAPLGFSKEAIVTVPLPEDPQKAQKLDPMYNQLRGIKGVEGVSMSFRAPSSDANWNSGWRFSDQAEYAPYPVNMKSADTSYFSTYGLQLVAGRVFQMGDTAREYVVNEAFVRKAGFRTPEEAIGKLIITGGRNTPPKPIVGVVKDFHLYSLHQGIDPCLIFPSKNAFSVAGLKLKSQNIPQTVEEIRKVWTATFPEFVFEHRFMDEIIARFYESEDRLAKLFQIFAGIAIFIGCLGLYGLVSFMAERKVKEIGVRKVLGASAGNIVFLFSLEFIRLVAIAFVVAAPVAYYLMQRWLQDFEYRIPIGAEIFLLAIGVTLLIAFLTVGYRSLRAATANPVKALRSE